MRITNRAKPDRLSNEMLRVWATHYDQDHALTKTCCGVLSQRCLVARALLKLQEEHAKCSKR